MAPTMLKHPFIDGNVKVPSDKLEAVEKIKSWMKSRPELPSISGEKNGTICYVGENLTWYRGLT